MFYLSSALAVSGIPMCLIGIVACLFLKCSKKPLFIGLAVSLLSFFIGMLTLNTRIESIGLDAGMILIGLATPIVLVPYYIASVYRQKNTQKNELKNGQQNQTCETTKLKKVFAVSIAVSICLVMFGISLILQSKNETGKSGTDEEISVSEKKPDIVESAEDRKKLCEEVVHAVSASSAFSPDVTATENKNGTYDVAVIFTGYDERHADVRWCSIDIADMVESFRMGTPDVFKKVETIVTDFSNHENRYCAKIDVQSFSSKTEIEFRQANIPDSKIIVVTQTDRNNAQAELEALRKKQIEEQYKLDVERKAREDKEVREKAATLFYEIRSAYKNNALSADDKYKGNSYTIIGKFNGVSEDGLFNELLDEIMVTVEIKGKTAIYYVFCSFDSDTWRDKLSALNVGDEMIITGTCLDWGIWSDCGLSGHNGTA